MKRKMNTRNKKALSPVVASIILIAVTVAVSIAVAAWMGALTFNFMATEQGQVTNLQFDVATKAINATFQNTGTTPITIAEAWVNGQKQATPTVPLNPVPGNNQTMVTISYPLLANGNQYEVKLVSSKGNTFLRTSTAPN
jgi:flagellin-like protein